MAEPREHGEVQTPEFLDPPAEIQRRMEEKLIPNEERRIRNNKVAFRVMQLSVRHYTTKSNETVTKWALPIFSLSLDNVVMLCWGYD